MGDSYKSDPLERDIEQAVTALKKGATLMKYGRRGRPKFRSFRLTNDESTLIWYSRKKEKQLKLNLVSKILPGQRTAVFQRFPRREKENQSFSLIYNDRSLDVICKDKDEAETWFVALKALTSGVSWRKRRNEARESSASTEASSAHRSSHSLSTLDVVNPFPQLPHQVESSTSPVSLPLTATEQSPTSDNFRVSLSSVVSSSSQGSGHGDFDSLGDVIIWGEGIGDGLLGGGTLTGDNDSLSSKFDAIIPKTLESTVALDVLHIACGSKHAALITKHGEIFSWGESSGGRLGHGSEVDISFPKLIGAFRGINIDLVSCGEYHTCAISTSGDLYTWGDGTYSSCMLGHGSECSHWIPKRVCGPLDGMHVSYVSCGPWHTAALISTGQLFTFGDGTFGVLGHGDHISSSYPRQVETLRGLRTVRVACGAWHTAAIVDVMVIESTSSERSFLTIGKLFTWGEGNKGQVGHEEQKARLLPKCVMDEDLCKVACGRELTVVLTTSGRVYTMGSPAYGQLGCPEAHGRTPLCIEGKFANRFIEDIACGYHHVACLTSKGEVFTWGRGMNGQLGHGDNGHKSEPTLVEFMKDKKIRSVACGSNYTAAICPHKWVGADNFASCTACHNLFGFRRKRRNCYNCGLVFCNSCSNHKSLKASLAPDMNKTYRVCNDCFVKLKKDAEPGYVRVSRRASRSHGGTEKEVINPKLIDLSFINSLKGNNIGHYKGNVKHGRVDSTTSNKHVSASAPGSRTVSRAGSFHFRCHRPVRSSSFIDSLSVPELSSPKFKHTDSDPNQEIGQLKAEVKKISGNYQLLEAELERTRKELWVAKAVATGEAEKSKVAKEVIKSLTSQLKDMAQKAQEANSAICKTDFCLGQSSGSAKDIFPTSEPNMKTTDAMLSNGGEVLESEKTEFIVQCEAGVYITLGSLPGGGNELRRVRFSRKRFSGEQAEKWWAENSSKVYVQHNIQS